MIKVKNIIIADYGMGNLYSIKRAIIETGHSAKISSEPEEIIKADKLILPGVGAFDKAMNEINRRNHKDAIEMFVKKGNPLLGICLGMQLLFTEGYEFGLHAGLNLIEGKVERFQESKDDENRFKIPQICWNSIYTNNKNVEQIWDKTILNGISNNSEFYFVHSYYCSTENTTQVIAQTNYGLDRYCSVVNKDNIWGCQFHPEKSGKNGLKIYKNFIEIIGD